MKIKTLVLITMLVAIGAPAAGASPPPAATLIAPEGSVATTTPTYTWEAAAGATWYYLWVENAAGPVLQQWYTAAETGCTDTCAVTPATAVADANTWWIQTWNDDGLGPWGLPLSFTVDEQIAFDAESALPPQTLAPGYTQIAMPQVTLNYGEGYSEATYDFAAPRAGVYQFNANVSIDTGGQNCGAFILSLFLNENEFRRLARTGGGGQFEIAGSALFRVSAGDVIDIRVFHNCANQVVVEANGKAYFNGALLLR